MAALVNGQLDFGTDVKIKSVKRTSAIRRDPDGLANLIGSRLKAARELHSPPMTIRATAERVEALGSYTITNIMLHKIEGQRRSVYDFEVKLLAQALGVDVRYLLGLTDEPGLQAPENPPLTENDWGRARPDARPVAEQGPEDLDTRDDG